MAQVVTALGGSALLIPLVLIAGLAWRVARGSWKPLVLLAGAYAAGEISFQILKTVVGRARPPAGLAIGHFTGLAFPSGHATLSLAVWGMLAALLAGGTSRAGLKAAAWAGAVFVTLVVGLTRLYLGAHWLTDVLAGWALGGLWLAVLLRLSRFSRFSRVSRKWPASRSGSASRSASP